MANRWSQKNILNNIRQRPDKLVQSRASAASIIAIYDEDLSIERVTKIAHQFLMG
jgi:hypothetical protein